MTCCWRLKSRAALLVVHLALLPALKADAACLVPGDILVSGTSAVGTGIIRIDPQTYEQTLIAQGPFRDFSVADAKTLYAVGAGGALFEIDAEGGGVRQIPSNGGVGFNGVAISSNGTLYALTTDSIFTVDPATGAIVLVTQVNPIYYPGLPGSRADLEFNRRTGGLVLITGAEWEVQSIDPVSKTATLLTHAGMGDNFDSIGSIAVDDQGSVWVVDTSQHSGAITRIDGTSTFEVVGSVYVHGEGAFFLRAWNVALSLDGKLLVSASENGGPPSPWAPDDAGIYVLGPGPEGLLQPVSPPVVLGGFALGEIQVVPDLSKELGMCITDLQQCKATPNPDMNLDGSVDLVDSTILRRILAGAAVP